MKLSIILFFSCLLYHDQWGQSQCGDDPYVGVTTSKMWSSADFCKLSLYDGPMTINSCSTIGGDWMLVINDEFSGPFLDSTLWTPRLPWSNGGVSSDLLSLKIPENISFNNGYIKFRGNFDPDPNKTYDYWAGGVLQPNKVHSDYTSGGISSQIDFPINSRYQIKCKAFPESSSNWSAFWLFGDQGQEIDIFEIVDAAGSLDDNVSDYFHKMTYHCKKYGSIGNPHDEAVQRGYGFNNLTTNVNQYDLIWDKYKIQWWFNGAVSHEITKFHYCPTNWTQSHLKKHFRKYPMSNYSAMSPKIGKKFAVNPYYPDDQSMKIIMDFDVRSNTTTNYTAQKTMDIDYIRVWLRANCGASRQVNQMNYVHEDFWQGQSIGGTTYELGKWVVTNATKNITVLNGHHCFYVATDEVALLNGFGAENYSIFSAYISLCGTAWDARMGGNDLDSLINETTEIENDNNHSEDFPGEEIIIKYGFENISVNSTQNKILSYELYDIAGKLILQKNVNDNLFEIKNENYSNGIYLLKIFKNNEIICKKIFL